jgi:hypothetical protein
MLSVYKQKEAYQAEERRLEEKFTADPAAPRVHSPELFEEFDVFVVQIKSTLDHMVKVMRPMLGRKWTMCTFADKGLGVLTSLQRNTGKHYLGRVKMMEAFVFTKRNFEWQEAVIATRDRANHNLDGGLKIETCRLPKLRLHGELPDVDRRTAARYDDGYPLGNLLWARGALHHDRTPLPLQYRRVGSVPRPPAALL